MVISAVVLARRGDVKWEERAFGVDSYEKAGVTPDELCSSGCPSRHVAVVRAVCIFTMARLGELRVLGPQTLRVEGDAGVGVAKRPQICNATKMVSTHGIIAVYILVNRKQGAIYTGVTSNLMQRIDQHRNGIYEGFAKKWGCKKLVWYQPHDMIAEAIRREKSIKSYRRKNKINLIEKNNPDWRDLWFDLIA